jgi:hypothetical protein
MYRASVGCWVSAASLSVPRQPAFAVAAYSALHLAAVLTFGPGRDERALPRPSQMVSQRQQTAFLDLPTLLRKELAENPAVVKSLSLEADWQQLGLAAA